MGTAPLVTADASIDRSHQHQELTDSDQAAIALADHEERVVNRQGAARGMLVGIATGALAWAGLILASAALFK